jgi:hypothetical protein
VSGDKVLLDEMLNCPDCGERSISKAKAQAAGEHKSLAEYLASLEPKKAQVSCRTRYPPPPR